MFTRARDGPWCRLSWSLPQRSVGLGRWSAHPGCYLGQCLSHLSVSQHLGDECQDTDCGPASDFPGLRCHPNSDFLQVLDVLLLAWVLRFQNPGSWLVPRREATACGGHHLWPLGGRQKCRASGCRAGRRLRAHELPRWWGRCCRSSWCWSWLCTRWC